LFESSLIAFVKL